MQKITKKEKEITRDEKLKVEIGGETKGEGFETNNQDV